MTEYRSPRSESPQMPNDDDPIANEPAVAAPESPGLRREQETRPVMRHSFSLSTLMLLVTLCSVCVALRARIATIGAYLVLLAGMAVVYTLGERRRRTRARLPCTDDWAIRSFTRALLLLLAINLALAVAVLVIVGLLFLICGDGGAVGDSPPAATATGQWPGRPHEQRVLGRHSGIHPMAGSRPADG